MKKKWLFVLMAGMMLTTAACNNGGSSSTGSDSTGGDAAGGSTPQVGVAIYKFDDTFMTGVRNAMSDAANGVAKLDIVDSQNAQPTQNEKIDLFISKKYSSMIINPVDRTAAGVIIDKAKTANTPVVFLNREPIAEDMNKWDKVYYVGAKAEESGTISGQLIVDYWKANPKADKNGDGKLQYVLLQGEPGHQDAELRTKFSVQAIQDAGIEVEALAVDTAMWDRVKGQEKMQTFLASHGDKIEAVLANNDDMALGAIEALKAAGYFSGDKYMPVVGVDATAPAVQALEDGTLLGTVLNDAKSQGKASVAIAAALSKGETPNKENTGFDITDGKYVWIAYKKITKDNIADAK
ncbi:galactose ABC transporter substrate-binding protein [Paenibacillus lautus]|uniref:galactose ABC transporter substrate-binding protein n=2 Tax=Bacilli TaxID=91061 RepID=UPI0002072FA3|nr:MULTISPECIES: galactose ABC transporter substrate-binding protein [Paenibacillus]EGG31002.1 D-galactose-binding periplasmic protein [Paenibacillus sp. HGF5]ETT67182.1 periplasmic-binding protein/LacI transcriptional regulator [Paenibacillus sp. FSL H8-457]PCL93568.1 galactose ABC transporter substrate-binding protein [Paenibacillus lautus]QOT11833.1 galactose ABC transporter substrate-binding protein [Paenibacillus sp. JNUCC-32]GIP03690.1 galactose ABC transporter substrate-binding protein 